MITIVVRVDAPAGSEQAVKETLAMYLERFGDTRVVSIQEDLPQQMTLDRPGAELPPSRYQRRR